MSKRKPREVHINTRGCKPMTPAAAKAIGEAIVALGDAYVARQRAAEFQQRIAAGERCHARGFNADGDCYWEACPQLRDKEPETTGRHCPLDVYDDDEIL